MSGMISDICGYLKNWFVVDGGISHGKFTVSGGRISLPQMQDGQYFRIVGSAFNDEVHRYPAANLADETFDGAVWAMAVPPAFLALVAEIEDYQSSDAAKPSPYVSESFGGYTYTKASGTTSAGGMRNANAWMSVFSSRLAQWRKL